MKILEYGRLSHVSPCMQNVNARHMTRNYEDSPIGVAACKQDDMACKQRNAGAGRRGAMSSKRQPIAVKKCLSASRILLIQENTEGPP